MPVTTRFETKDILNRCFNATTNVLCIGAANANPNLSNQYEIDEILERSIDFTNKCFYTASHTFAPGTYRHTEQESWNVVFNTTGKFISTTANTGSSVYKPTREILNESYDATDGGLATTTNTNGYLGTLREVREILNQAFDPATNSLTMNFPSGYSFLLKNNTGLFTDGAAHFSAVNKEYLTCAHSANNALGDFDFEFGKWVYLDSVTADRGIISKLNIGAPGSFSFMLRYQQSSGRFRCSIYSGTTSTSLNADTFGAPSASNWYFVVARYNAATDKVQISVNNGAFNGSDHAGGAVTTSFGLNLGLSSDGTNAVFMDGREDSGYFTKTLSSAAELTALYNGGAGRMYDGNNGLAENGLATFKSNLISWWGLNEPEGIRYDAHGTNHLTPSSVQLINATTLNGGFGTLGTNGGTITGVSTSTVARTSDVVTIVTAAAHGLTSTNVVTVTGLTDTTLNATNVAVTVVNVDTFSYTKAGDDVTLVDDTGGRVATDVFANWTETTLGTSTVNADNVITYAGTYACRFDIDSSSGYAGLTAGVALTVGRKYKLTFYAKGASGTPLIGVEGLSGTSSATLTTSYAQYSFFGTATQSNLVIKRSSATSNSIYLDNVTLESVGPISTAGIASGATIDANYAATFTASNQSLAKASNATLQSGAGDFTVWAWINQDKTATGTQLIVNKYNAAASKREYMLATAGTTAYFYASADGATAVNAAIANAITPGNWTLLIGEFNSATGKIQLTANNVASSETTLASILQSDSDFIIAMATTFGRVDQTGIIKRLLTAGEKTALFNNGKGAKANEAAFPSTVLADAVSIWSVDPATGITTDVKGANTLTNNNAVTFGQGVNYESGAVALHIDQSANLKNFTQTVPSRRPGWVMNGIDSQYALRFDGVDDALLNATDLIGTGDITFCTVFVANSSGAVAGRILDNNVFTAFVSGSTMTINSASTAGSTITFGNRYVLSCTISTAGVVNAWLNGTQVITNTAGTARSAGSATYLGNNAALSRGFDGFIAEPVLYSSILSTAQRQAVERFLAAKFQITYLG